MLERSPQVVVGYFDFDSVNASQLNANEPVEMSFIIEKKIKWNDSLVEKFIVPVPYKLFLLNTEKAKDDFKREWRIIRTNFLNKKAEFEQGVISDSEWQQYSDIYEDFFSSHKGEIQFVQSNWWKGSFRANIKYMMFLHKPIGSSDVDWEKTISMRTIQLGGQGTLSDMLLENIE